MTNIEILFKYQRFSFMLHTNDFIFSVFERNTLQIYVENVCSRYKNYK